MGDLMKQKLDIGHVVLLILFVSSLLFSGGIMYSKIDSMEKQLIENSKSIKTIKKELVKKQLISPDVLYSNKIEGKLKNLERLYVLMNLY